MRILMLNTEKGWRGGERQTLLSMMGLRDAGIEVQLLCLCDRPLFAKASDAGFSPVGIKNQAAAFIWIVRHAGRFSLLHAQSSRIFGFAAFAKVCTRTPLVYTRRVDFMPRGAVTRWKYRQADALAAISFAIRDVLRTAGVGEAEVISSIVSGHIPDGSRARRFEQEHGLAGKRVVGVIAALVGHKDPLTMVRAACRVINQASDVVFVHFGDGLLRNDVLNACRQEGIEKQYLLAGYVDTVEDFFPLFRCFAMSSREEGLGSTVLDAFTARVPVASTAAGGLAELVRDRGLVSPVGDDAALADNIIRLLSDRRQADGFTDAAAGYVVRHHGRDVITAKYIALYRKVLGIESV